MLTLSLLEPRLVPQISAGFLSPAGVLRIPGDGCGHVLTLSVNAWGEVAMACDDNDSQALWNLTAGGPIHTADVTRIVETTNGPGDYLCLDRSLGGIPVTVRDTSTGGDRILVGAPGATVVLGERRTTVILLGDAGDTFTSHGDIIDRSNGAPVTIHGNATVEIALDLGPQITQPVVGVVTEAYLVEAVVDWKHGGVFTLV